MSWHLAPSLEKLRDEVNALWPSRSKTHDGTIGDRAHSARRSDHNPNARGSVNAIDITAKGINVTQLIDAAKRHPSVRYIIHAGKIYNRDIGNFRPRAYHGSNPHNSHVHISIYQRRSAENDRRAWGISKSTSKAPAKKPAPRKQAGKAPAFPLPAGHWYGPESKNSRNHSGYWEKDRAGIKQWQTQMKRRGWRINPDGYYGAQSYRVCKAFQKEKGLRVDGGVGIATWKATWEEPVT
ncbi:peptidoglycan-binding domain-containing protein [Brevibacterium sp. UMB10442]|nr:peptidoglycan-binding domain-containing protein [Brevibacterium sp. UMB10442]